MNVEITGLTRDSAVPGGGRSELRTGPGVLGLLGPNGAGKTSLLRMMATVIPPSSGRLRLLDHDPGADGPRREIRRRLGYLPQTWVLPGFHGDGIRGVLRAAQGGAVRRVSRPRLPPPSGALT